MTRHETQPQEQVLVVEDSRFFATAIKSMIEDNLGIAVNLAKTYSQARDILKKKRDHIFLALLDLNLPDAPDGEIVDYFIEAGVPSVVFTGTFDDKTRERILAKGVIDYVVKDSPASLDYLINLVRRLRHNQATKALLVDDSRVSLQRTGNLLREYQFEVLQAENGVEALKVFKDHPDIKLLVTDYQMPKMDGIELIKTIRRDLPRDRLAIIGLSSTDEKSLSARFIKTGANDFLSKSFEREEFFCRVSQNMDLLEHIEALRDAATKDYLTHLFNRRYFYDVGQPLITNAMNNEANLAVAILDVDFFKKVNDTYGHKAGDDVLKALAQVLAEKSQDDHILAARLGGEEFAVLVEGLSDDECSAFFDDIRQAIEDLTVKTGAGDIKITTSFGVCTTVQSGSLDAVLKRADEMLYLAKKRGRNQVVMIP